MEELVREIFFKCLEYGTNLSYVVNLEERNSRTFEDIERLVDVVKSLLARTLFEWSRIWGFTHCISMFDFLIFASSSL